MPPAEPKEPRTEAGKAAETRLPHFDTCAGMRGPNPCDCGVVSTILAIEEQSATESDLRLLVMTTARDAAVVEADRLREAATEARRDLDVDVLTEALGALPGGPAYRQSFAERVAAEYRRLIEESHDQPKPPARPGTDPLTGKAHGKQRQDPLTGTWHDV